MQDLGKSRDSKEQVHVYMVEEIQEVIQQRNQILYPRPRKHSLFHSAGKEQGLLEEDVIVIPQETYYFGSPEDSTSEVVSPSEAIPSRQTITLENVPSFVRRQQ